MAPILNGRFERIENPTDEQLWDEISNFEPWHTIVTVEFEKTHPALWLFYCEAENKIKLEFHNQVDGKYSEYYSFTGKKSNKILSVADPGGGESFKIFAHFFVTKKEAFSIAKDFIQTAQKSNKIYWLEPEFDDYPYNKKYVVNKEYSDEAFHDSIAELDLPELCKKILKGYSYNLNFNTEAFCSSLSLKYSDKLDKYKICWRKAKTFYAYHHITQNIILDKTKKDEDDELFKIFYVEKTLAVEALLHFVEAGQRTDKIKWLNQKSEFYPDNRKLTIHTDSFAQYCNDISDIDFALLNDAIHNRHNVHIISNQFEGERSLELWNFEVENGYLIAYDTYYKPENGIHYRRKYYYAFNPIPATGILPTLDKELQSKVETFGVQLTIPRVYDNMLIDREQALNTALYFIENGEMSDIFEWREKNNETFPKDSTLAKLYSFFKDDLPF